MLELGKSALVIFGAGVFFWYGHRISKDKPLDKIDRFCITAGLWMFAGYMLISRFPGLG